MISPDNEINEGDAVLFKTKNSRSGLAKSGEFRQEYVCIGRETAKFLVKKKASLVGTDYVSVDEYGDKSCPVHNEFAKAGVLVLEGINLSDVPAGNYTLICFPLKIKAEASPVRAVLI